MAHDVHSEENSTYSFLLGSTNRWRYAMALGDYPLDMFRNPSMPRSILASPFLGRQG